MSDSSELLAFLVVQMAGTVEVDRELLFEVLRMLNVAYVVREPLDDDTRASIQDTMDKVSTELSKGSALE